MESVKCKRLLNLIWLLLFSTIFALSDIHEEGIVVKIFYPAPGQKEWNPLDWIQVHIDVEVTDGYAAELVRQDPFSYSLCYYGYHPDVPPICKPLVEGGQPGHQAKSHSQGTTTDSHKIAETNQLAVKLFQDIENEKLNSISNLGVIEVWVQKTSLFPHPKSHIGSLGIVYLWTDPIKAIDTLSNQLRFIHQMNENEINNKSNEQGLEGGKNKIIDMDPLSLNNLTPKLVQDRIAIMKHLVVAFQNSQHPLATIAFNCLARLTFSHSQYEEKNDELINSTTRIVINEKKNMNQNDKCDLIIKGEIELLLEKESNILHQNLDNIYSQYPQISENFPSLAISNAYSLGLIDLLIDLSSNKKQQSSSSIILLLGSGLSNRLRPLISALIFARLSRRTLYILWPIEPHCLAKFSDLFTLPHDLEHTNSNIKVYEFELSSPLDFVDTLFEHANSTELYIYSHFVHPIINLQSSNINNHQNENVDEDGGLKSPRHVFIRSVDWLVSNIGDTRPGGDLHSQVEEQFQLLHYGYSPSSSSSLSSSSSFSDDYALDFNTIIETEVNQEAFKIEQALLNANSVKGEEGKAELVTVHIRMQNNISLDIPSQLPHMAVEMETLGDVMKEYRELCTPENILIPMRQIDSYFRSQGKKTVFYVASDVSGAVTAIAKSFAPGLVLGYHGNLCQSEVLDRSKECMQRAMIDQRILGHQKAKFFIQSKSSSFSLVVEKLSLAITISGCGYFGSSEKALSNLYSIIRDQKEQQFDHANNNPLLNDDHENHDEISNHGDLFSQFIGNNQKQHVRNLRKDCGLVSNCVIYISTNDIYLIEEEEDLNDVEILNRYISGVKSLLYAIASQTSRIKPGFPFQQWKVKLLLLSPQSTGWINHVLKKQLLDSGIELVNLDHLANNLLGVDRWLLRPLDSRLDYFDEACVAMWATSGIASHHVVDHPSQLSPTTHTMMIGSMRGVLTLPQQTNTGDGISKMMMMKCLIQSGVMLHHSIQLPNPNTDASVWRDWIRWSHGDWLFPILLSRSEHDLFDRPCSGCPVASSGGLLLSDLNEMPYFHIDHSSQSSSTTTSSSTLRIISPKSNQILFNKMVDIVIDIRHHLQDKQPTKKKHNDDGKDWVVCFILIEVWGNKTSSLSCQPLEDEAVVIEKRLVAPSCHQQKLYATLHQIGDEKVEVEEFVDVFFLDRPFC